MLKAVDHFWIDSLSLSISGILIGLGMEMLKASGETSWNGIVLAIVPLCTCFLLGLLIVSKMKFRGKTLSGYFSIPIGLFLWLLLHTALGLIIDRKYISVHPEDIARRHSLLLWFRLALTPFFGLFALTLMAVLRASVSVWRKINLKFA